VAATADHDYCIRCGGDLAPLHEATFDAIGRRVRGFGAVFDQDAHPITDLVHEFVPRITGALHGERPDGRLLAR